MNNSTPPRLDSQAAQRSAADLIAHGYSVCRIQPGEKRPTYPRWATYSIAPSDLEPGDGIGLICGPVSDTLALVCIDLDSRRAVRRADQCLPVTAMVEGREGKPRSHRWFQVPLAGIPENEHSHAAQSAPVMRERYGHPGPRTISFRSAKGVELIRVIGTGGQAVVPPAIHPSGERREWDAGKLGTPAVVNFNVLLNAVRRLARKCGWEPKAESDATSNTNTTTDIPDAAISPFLAFRINRYLDEIPPSISGQGGHDACYRAACVLVWGFALSTDHSIKFLSRFNARCQPKWSERELRHKVREAANATDHTKTRGHLI